MDTYRMLGKPFQKTRSEQAHKPLHKAVFSLAGTCVLALTLSACGSGGVEGLGGLIGGGSDPNPPQTTRVSPVTATTFGGVSVEQLRADQLCPSVLVRDGTETLRLYNDQMDRGPEAVRYQAQIVQTAIECTPGNGQFGLSIGIAGRVLIGPQGSPASLDMPIRIVVRDQINGTVISSEVVRATAVIEPPEVSATFTLVNSSYFIPTPTRQADYQVLLGFDEANRDG